MSLKGIHIDEIKDILLDRNKNINFFQIFVNPMKDNNTNLGPYIEYAKKHNKLFVVHSSYSINIAKKWHDFDWWVEYMIREIQLCDLIGAFGIVIHSGKQLDQDMADALNNMYTLLLHIHRQTSNSNTKLLIETPAGQGTELLSNVDAYCKFMSKFFKNPNLSVQTRFGCCIDSCHIFAAGYDISKLSNYFMIIERKIGLDKIKLCHLNDSKETYKSRKDRHANIGNGKIGKKKLIKLAKFMITLRVPIILETPYPNIYIDLKFITQTH